MFFSKAVVLAFPIAMTQYQGEAKEGSIYAGFRVQSFQYTVVEQRCSPSEGQEGRKKKREKGRRRRI